MPLATRSFDVAEYLDSDEMIAAYLSEAMASNEPAHIADALGAVARARGMTEVARQAGVSRESLYRALSSKGNPELSTLIGVMKACGVRLSAVSDKVPPKGSQSSGRARRPRARSRVRA